MRYPPPMKITLLTPEELEDLLVRAVQRALSQATIPAVLSTEQAAEVAGVNPKTIREWICAGKLTAGRRGRLRTIRREDLDRYLAGKSDSRQVEDIIRSLRRERPPS